jgi:hypothetical protein
MKIPHRKSRPVSSFENELTLISYFGCTLLCLNDVKSLFGKLGRKQRPGIFPRRLTPYPPHRRPRPPVWIRDAFVSRRWCVDRPSPIVVVVVFSSIAFIGIVDARGAEKTREASHTRVRVLPRRNIHISRPTTETDYGHAETPARDKYGSGKPKQPMMIPSKPRQTPPPWSLG